MNPPFLTPTPKSSQSQLCNGGVWDKLDNGNNHVLVPTCVDELCEDTINPRHIQEHYREFKSGVNFLILLRPKALVDITRNKRVRGIVSGNKKNCTRIESAYHPVPTSHLAVYRYINPLRRVAIYIFRVLR